MSETNRETHGLFDLTRALGRWSNEGGAATATPGSHDLALQPGDERLLVCLGASVVLRWSHLPTEIQRDLFESAASVEDPVLQRELTEQLGRYLHRRNGD